MAVSIRQECGRRALHRFTRNLLRTVLSITKPRYTTMPAGMMYSVVFLFLDVPIVRDTARNFQYHSSVGLYGALCDAHGGGLCPEAMGEEEGRGGLATRRATSMRGRKSRREWRVAAVGMGRGYCLTRLRPASMRRKMNNRIVKPHSDEPP